MKDATGTEMVRKACRQRKLYPKHTMDATNHQDPHEFQKVAALVCLDLDLLHDISRRSRSLVDLQNQVRSFWEQKNELTTNREIRDSRFAAAYALFHLPKRPPSP